jgi:hypothetical protein
MEMHFSSMRNHPLNLYAPFTFPLSAGADTEQGFLGGGGADIFIEDSDKNKRKTRPK